MSLCWRNGKHVRSTETSPGHMWKDCKGIETEVTILPEGLVSFYLGMPPAIVGGPPRWETRGEPPEPPAWPPVGSCCPVL